MISPTTKHRNLSELTESRLQREASLRQLDGIYLAGLVIDYGIWLTEDSDPVELILDYEFELYRESFSHRR